jgi:hypothetical protein
VSSTELDAQLAALTDEQAHPDTAESQNRTVRTWLVRRLLDDPVRYYRTLSPENRAYLDRQRGFLAANIEEYVTHKTLDGLYLMIGEEEHAIRQNPAAAGSAIVSKVFGALH